ncbi:MAG: Asp23/Gls24 family envelope stress response protein [Gaiellaceae bacterium]
MEERAQISPEVLARYAGDAALEVQGVVGLAEGSLQRDRAVEISSANDGSAVTVRIELEWGSSAADVAREVQTRVAEYLGRMANLTVRSVDVVVDGVGAPPAKQ